MEAQAREIAQTIMSQIKYVDPYAFWAWGSKDYTALPQGENQRGGLRFRVNGAKFKGLVKVVLTGADLYDVYLIRNYKGQEIVKDSIKEIFCEDLMATIDQKIER